MEPVFKDGSSSSSWFCTADEKSPAAKHGLEPDRQFVSGAAQF
jgi:hypothetical protein